MNKSLRDNQNGKMWTYIATDLSHTYKIGKSTNIEERICSLAIGNPNIKLVFTIQADVEIKLHSTFKDRNYFGEWFALSEDDIKRIKLEYARYITTPQEDEIAKKHKMWMGTCLCDRFPFSLRKKPIEDSIDYYFSYVVQHMTSNCFIFGLTKDITYVLDVKARIKGGFLLGYARGNWYNSGVTLKTQHWGAFSDYKKFKSFTGKNYVFVKAEK